MLQLLLELANAVVLASCSDNHACCIFISLITFLDTTFIILNYELPLTQKPTVAAVQEKYMKDDEDTDDD